MISVMAPVSRFGGLRLMQKTGHSVNRCRDREDYSTSSARGVEGEHGDHHRTSVGSGPKCQLLHCAQ